MPHTPIRELIEDQVLLTRPPSATVREAAEAMAESHVGAVLVVEDGRLRGIFTERDALNRVLAKRRDPDRTTLAEVMTRDPDTLGPDHTVADAVRAMDEFGYRHLPVQENGRPIGIVSLRDIALTDIAKLKGELELRHMFVERGL